MHENKQIVYVLVSSHEDLYYEQTYISISSLRKAMKGVNVILLTDENTAINLKGFRGQILELVDDHKTIKTNTTYNLMQKSRYLKTKMREYVSGDFLYIDGDTLVCEDLSSVFYYEKDLYAILDIHQPFSTNINREYLQYKVNKLGWHASYNNCHFNGGVLFSKDSEESHTFFDLWHKLWLESVSKGVSFDQSSLNEANYRLNGIIQELDGTWNCQVAYGLNYLNDAKIIHYFGSNIGKRLPYRLTNVDILKKMKYEEKLTYEIQEIISKPKNAFNSSIIVSDENIIEIVRTDFFSFLAKNYSEKSLLYKFIKFHLRISTVFDLLNKKLFSSKK